VSVVYDVLSENDGIVFILHYQYFSLTSPHVWKLLS